MIRFLSALFTLPLAAILGLLWFVLAEQPIVEPGETATVFHRSPPTYQEIELTTRIEAGLSRLPFPSAARVTLRTPEEMEIAVTVKTPLPRPFLNLTGLLQVQDQQRRLSHVQLGSLPLPGALFEWLFSRFPALADLPATGGNRHAVPPRPWEPFLADHAILGVYHRALSRWSRRSPRHPSLLEPFRQLFRLARQRSSDRTAAEENRALLQVLAAFALGKDPATVFGLPRQPLRRVHPTLKGRRDLARHFLVSAAVAASGHAALSAALGLYKEFSDFNTGSGFSFSDLAADKAGTEFGTMAVTRPRYLQSVMVQARKEDWFMPAITGLPDHLSRQEFERRFDGPNRAAYASMIRLIERRIAACPLYRARPSKSLQRP